MAVRDAPISRVQLRSQVARYTRTTRGWGAYDIMSELSGEMEETLIGVAGAAWGQYKGMWASWWPIDGNIDEPGVHLISDPVNAMIVTPRVDNSQRLDLTAFDIEGDFTDNWCDYLRDFDGNAVMGMFNAAPPLISGTVGYTRLKSRFILPRDPMFAIRLWRSMPAENITAEGRYQMSTQIQFGMVEEQPSADRPQFAEEPGYEVLIKIPYEREPEIWYRHLTHTGNTWRIMPGKTRRLQWASTPTPRNMPNAQFTTLWIGAFRNGIVLSGDKFQDNFTYVEFPIHAEPIDDQHQIYKNIAARRWNGREVDGQIHHVSSGKVQVGHNGGMYFVQFLPLQTAQHTTDGDGVETILSHHLIGPLHNAGYAKPGAEYTMEPEELVMQARKRHKPQPRGTENPAFMNDPTKYNQEAKILLVDLSQSLAPDPGDPDSGDWFHQYNLRATRDTSGEPPRIHLREWMAQFGPTRWAYQFVRAYRNNGMQKYKVLADEDDVNTDPVGLTTFYTHLTPELYAVNVAEFPRIVENLSPGTERLDHLAPSIGYSFPPDAHGAECRTTFDNLKGEVRELPLRGSNEVTIELGYHYDDDTVEYTQVLTGILRDHRAHEAALTNPVIVPRIPDFMEILAQTGSDGLTPCFDGWPVWRVFQWVLRRCGFHDSEMGIVQDAQGHFSVDMTDVTKGIEETEGYTTIGHPEEPLWRPARNADWISFLNEVARHDFDADFWFDPDGTFTKGCRYCRRRRDGSADPDISNDPLGANPSRHVETIGPNSTGCVAYDKVRVGDSVGIDYDLYTKGSDLITAGVPLFESEIASIEVHRYVGDRKRFANSVVIQAPDRTSTNTLAKRRRGEQAQPLTAIAEDRDSISNPLAENFAHGEATFSRDEEMAVNQGTINLMARRDLARLSATNKYIEVELLSLNQAVKKGMVFRINGGDMSSVDNDVFRVEYVEHAIPTQTIRDSHTRFGGVYLRTEVPA